MRLRLFPIVMIFTSVICFCTTSYATEVSGDVWGVWDASMNPIEVVGELRVPQESSLFIGPGCYIEFQGHYKFIVDTAAVLQANGVDGDSIIFTSNYPSTWWFGLRFYNGGSGSELSYCILEYGMAEVSDNPQYWSDYYGGAVLSESTDLVLRNCSIRNNRAPQGGKGGGIYIEYADIIIDSCEISDNFCGFRGSGLYSSHGNVILTNNVFERDTTYYMLGGDLAGAIGFQSSPSIIMIGNIFRDNFAGTAGGGGTISADTVVIISNVFEGNTALSAGGGLAVGVSGRGTIMNNLFFNNETTNPPGGGGGLLIAGSGISLINNVIAYNSSASRAGGLKCNNLGSNFAANNIIYGNSAPLNPQIYDPQDSLNLSYSNIQGGWPGVGNIDIDPLFRDTANGDFHLMSLICGDPYESPCIDAGDPAFQDIRLECDWGLGYFPSDMGAYGGGDSVFQMIEDHFPAPARFTLMQNYPNPFNARTKITFNLPYDSYVRITVYDILGRQTRDLINDVYQSGKHIVEWDGKDNTGNEVSSGFYFYTFEADEFTSVKKMLMLK